MKIAIEGCCHGALDDIYFHIASLEVQNNYKVDLLLICGDFQAIRNERDLQCMAVPDKYRALGGFYKYYTGEKNAPILTIVIGGNHEASNYFWELYHGGWIAPNMFFLGHAGIFLSHDWPQSIERHGNLHGLLKRKPYFKGDIETGSLGSPPMMGLLRTLKPEWWFSAHLHCRFEATVLHPDTEVVHEGAETVVERNPDEIVIEDEGVEDEIPAAASAAQYVPGGTPAPAVVANPDEIVLDDEEEEVAKPPPPPPKPLETKFLALDKCLPRRQFLEVVDIPTGSSSPSPVISYDPEWLAITRAFNRYMSTNRPQLAYPDEATAREAVQRELEWVKAHVFTDATGASLEVKPVEDVQVFAKTAPGPGEAESTGKVQPPHYPNPQTAAFCSMLEIENKVDHVR
ncbi:hypothetical protein EUX98_g4588 [Antrodiella citrinella]|uniref:Lariat debranching enzyme C-terminal domain-containing protein n=1 Tax=Antrodiella citrinella TaxID=2447956 RepID=A0A4S4MVK4_9APHY|nr:hypothetical protein EUX98_g4588 [Antrodiella citrinella]